MWELVRFELILSAETLEFVGRTHKGGRKLHTAFVSYSRAVWQFFLLTNLLVCLSPVAGPLRILRNRSKLETQTLRIIFG